MAKRGMRALVLLSAASMVLAVAPPATAAESPAQAVAAPQTGGDRYGDDGCNSSSSSYSFWGSGHSGSNCQQVTLCHWNRNTQSYQQLTVPSNSLQLLIHQFHLFFNPPDIIPAPADGCPKPGYTAIDVHLWAWHKDNNKVLFKLWGCAPGSSVPVKIDGTAVSGSPFTVGTFGILIKIVAIPPGKPGDNLTASCVTPNVTTTVAIQ